MISAIVVVVLTFAVAGTAVFFKLRQPKTEWVKIPLAGGAQYQPGAHVNEKRLSEAFFKARDLLWTKTNFPASRVNAALQNTSIKVMEVDSWFDSVGRKVGGEMVVPYCPVVGKDLSALLHELVHVVEFAHDGTTDNEHTKWEVRGVWAADNAYRAWLAERSAVVGIEPT